MKLYKFNFSQNLNSLINYKNAAVKAGDQEHAIKAAKIIIKLEDGRILNTEYSLVDGATFGVAKAYAKRGMAL